MITIHVWGKYQSSQGDVVAYGNTLMEAKKNCLIKTHLKERLQAESKVQIQESAAREQARMDYNAVGCCDNNPYEFGTFQALMYTDEAHELVLKDHLT